MKAWLIRVKDGECAEVVFAETRGKARSWAMCTDTCDGADFTDIEAHRVPHVDKYYKKGKRYMDWDDPKDRIVLFEECGFRCEYVEAEFCEDCPVKKYCEDYINQMEEWEELANEDGR